MPKRKCIYKEEFESKWSFIKKGRFDHEAECKICNCFLNIAHGGQSDIKDHINSNKHLNNYRASSSSQKIDNFFIKDDSNEQRKITLAELTMAFHLVKHHQSFRSADCTSKLYGMVFEDSKVAQKFSSGRSKTIALVKNILAPYSLQILNSDLEKVHYFGLSTDGSNHKSEKMFVLLIHYFLEDKGLQLKVIKVDSLKNEKSDTVVNFICETLKEHNIALNKCIAFGADNTNCNFGGLERRGVENIYYKLKEKVPNIRGAGCSAHVLHNTARKACEILNVDVELVVIKIFSFFKSFTLRTERLKELCDFIDMEYHQLLSHSKVRWLTLMPAVERILKIYEGLKSLISTTENAPKFLTNFFSNPLGEAYLWTVHSFLSCFNNQILKIEREKITIIEVRAIMDETAKMIENRIRDKFLPLKTKEILRNSGLEVQIIEDFKNEIIECYLVAKTYLNKWIAPLKQFSFLQWMLLEEVPQWEEVSTCLELLSKDGISLNENEFYNQFCCIKGTIENKIAADNDAWKSQSCVE